jgi:hypothetical protein
VTGLRHPEWGPHVKGLAQPTTVWSDKVQETTVRMLQASRFNALMAVIGPPGTGKSHAAGRAAEACESDPAQPAEVVWVQLPKSTSEKDLLVYAYPQIVGVPAPAGRGVLIRDLAEDIRLALAERHRVLIVDEAQFAKPQALNWLRSLHDDFRTDFAQVLITTWEGRRRLAREIRSRGSKKVEFELLADSQILEFLHGYDPLFTTADPDLLKRRHKTHARGEIRWWAYFLREAQQYVDPGATLTDELVEISAQGVPRL